MWRRTLLSVFMLWCWMQVPAQGIDFIDEKWNEALERSKAENKMIFVDGYATWCGPCKALAKNIFPLEGVGRFFNQHFINIKLDMEKGDGLTFRKKYPVSAFPTLYFIAPDGDLVQATKGAPRSGEALIELAEQAIKKFDESSGFLAKYQAGDHSFDNTIQLVQALNKSGKPSLLYVNEFLREQENPESEENLRILFEGLTQVDSRLFDLFLKYREEIAKIYSEEEIEKKIRMAAEETAQRAIEYHAPSLLTEAQEKYSDLYPEKGDEFIAQSKMIFALGTQDEAGFIEALSDKNLTEENLVQALPQGLNIFNSAEVGKHGEKIVKKWIKNSEDPELHFLLVCSLVLQEDWKAADSAIEKCMELAGSRHPNHGIYEEYQQVIKQKQ